MSGRVASRMLGCVLIGLAALLATRAVVFVPEASACLPGFKPKPGVTNPTDNERDCEPESEPASPPAPLPGETAAPPEPKRPPRPAIVDPKAQRKKVEDFLKKPPGGEGSGERPRPTTPPTGRGDGTDEAIKRIGEKLRKCTECEYRITSTIEELKGLHIPAGFPKVEVTDEVNYVSQAGRASMIGSYRDIQDAAGRLTSAIGLAGGLVTGGVAVAAIELMGVLAGELSDPGQLFADPDALAGGFSRGITAIRIKFPVYVVDARLFNVNICEKEQWKPFKGLYFAADGPKEWEVKAPDPQGGPEATIADLNRMKLERANAFASQMYQSQIANVAKLRAFLARAKATTPSACKLNLSDSDFAGVPPEGSEPAPAPKKKDCAAILAKIKDAEAGKAALQKQLPALQSTLVALTGKLEGLKGRLAEAQGRLRKADNAVRAKRAGIKSIEEALVGLQGKATGGTLTAEEIARWDQLKAVRGRYISELEALEAAHGAAREQVGSITAEIAATEAEIARVKGDVTRIEGEIAGLDRTIAGLRAEHERCVSENR